MENLNNAEFYFLDKFFFGNGIIFEAKKDDTKIEVIIIHQKRNYNIAEVREKLAKYTSKNVLVKSKNELTIIL